MLAVDYLARFLEHPTWPAAVVMAAAILGVSWIIVALIANIFHDDD